MIQLPTYSELLQIFLAGAQAKAQSLDMSIDVSEFSNYQIQGAAVAGIGSGITQDVNTQYNNVYPQYADAQGINLGLANSGIPALYPATPAILTLAGTGLVSGKTYNIPVGTIITAPNGATYSIISTTTDLTEVVITSVSNVFYAVSTLSGQNTNQNNGVSLTFIPAIISTDQSSVLSACTVSSSVDGVNQETIANATNRLIEIKQTPLCSARATDFKYLAIDPSNNVTDAIVLIKNQLDYTDPLLNVGIFDVSGIPITDDVLNQGLFTGTTEVVFTRTSSNGSIDNTQEVMNQQDIVGVFPNVSTVSTQQITALTGSDAFFQVTVTLQPGYSLSSEVTLDGNIFTVEQLIQKEVRRAVCAQPYGASLVQDISTGAYTSSTLAISSIEQQLDTALGTPTTIGVLGSFLLDRTILVWDGTAYVYQSSIALTLGIPTASNGKLPWIYDISTTVGKIYSNILVVTS